MRPAEYIKWRCREIKNKELHPEDKEVSSLLVFSENAHIYAAYTLTIIEWGRVHRAFNGQDSILIVPT